MSIDGHRQFLRVPSIRRSIEHVYEIRSGVRTIQEQVFERRVAALPDTPFEHLFEDRP